MTFMEHVSVLFAQKTVLAFVARPVTDVRIYVVISTNDTKVAVTSRWLQTCKKETGRFYTPSEYVHTFISVQ